LSTLHVRFLTESHVHALVHTFRDAMAPARNDPCPCGSGSKFKKCCASKVLLGMSVVMSGAIDEGPEFEARKREAMETMAMSLKLGDDANAGTDA